MCYRCIAAFRTPCINENLMFLGRGWIYLRACTRVYAACAVNTSRTDACVGVYVCVWRTRARPRARASDSLAYLVFATMTDRVAERTRFGPADTPRRRYFVRRVGCAIRGSRSLTRVEVLVSEVRRVVELYASGRITAEGTRGISVTSRRILNRVACIACIADRGHSRCSKVTRVGEFRLLRGCSPVLFPREPDSSVRYHRTNVGIGEQLRSRLRVLRDDPSDPVNDSSNSRGMYNIFFESGPRCGASIVEIADTRKEIEANSFDPHGVPDLGCVRGSRFPRQ